MKKIIFTTVLILAANANIAQTYNMRIKQGTVTTYSQTSTVDEITFDDASNFSCGNPVLYGGETYPTVQIGSQCWFQRNLNIGTRIAGSSNQTSNGIIEKYCYNNLNANCATYGGLYQWAEAVQYQNGATNTSSPSPAFSGNIQGICPPGWHIPSYADFQTLSSAVSTNGNTLKEVGEGDDIYGTGTNTSGFSALLAGSRKSSDPIFHSIGIQTMFWSSTEHDAIYAKYMGLLDTQFIILLSDYSYNYKVNGYRVRCLKD